MHGRRRRAAGVLAGVAERPNVRYVVPDWSAKLQPVAAGLAITTLRPSPSARCPTACTRWRCAPPAAAGGPRLVLARLPGRLSGAAAAVAEALATRGHRRTLGMAVGEVEASYEGGGLEVGQDLHRRALADSLERRLAAELSTYAIVRELTSSALMERYEDGRRRCGDPRGAGRRQAVRARPGPFG